MPLLDESPARVPGLSKPCAFDVQGTVEDGNVTAGPIVARGFLGYLMMTTRPGAGPEDPRIPDDDHLLYVPWSHKVTDAELDGPEHTAEMYQLLGKFFGLPRELWPALLIYLITGAQIGRTQEHPHKHVRRAVHGDTTVTFRNLGG